MFTVSCAHSGSFFLLFFPELSSVAPPFDILALRQGGRSSLANPFLSISYLFEARVVHTEYQQSQNRVLFPKKVESRL